MKEYMSNCNRLAGSAKLADELLIYKNNPIHIFFASTTKLFKILIKDIKQHFKIF